MLSPLVGKGKETSSVIEEFVVNGENTSDPDLISNAFCEFFSNIGCKLQMNIAVPIINYDNLSYKTGREKPISKPDDHT